VFEESFDAKSFTTKNFLFRNSITFIIIPFSGKWNLVNDYTDYEHSSGSFYETGILKNYQPFDFRVLIDRPINKARGRQPQRKNQRTADPTQTQKIAIVVMVI
jgi:hypothetical protein